MNVIEFITRIIISIFLGTTIGLERQLTGHPAGIRTNMLICLGSCMFLLFPMILESNDIQRVASYIVSGVGFLCSGVIFKENGTVKGLNTAATLWCSAAIGVLVSSGMYIYAILATISLILSNIIFRPISKRIMPLSIFSEEEQECEIILECSKKYEVDFKNDFFYKKEHNRFIIKKVEILNKKNNKIQINLIIQLSNKNPRKDFMYLLNYFYLNNIITKVNCKLL